MFQPTQKAKKTQRHFFTLRLWGLGFFVSPSCIPRRCLPNGCLGGGFLNMSYFHLELWGRWNQFDEHIFQMGWFNHQLVAFFSTKAVASEANGSLASIDRWPNRRSVVVNGWALEENSYVQLAGVLISWAFRTQNPGWFIGYFGGEEILQLMVDWWFGLVVWIPWIPLRKGLLLRGTPRIPNHEPKPPIYH